MSGRFEDGLTDSRRAQRAERLPGAKHPSGLTELSTAKHRHGMAQSPTGKRLHGLKHLPPLEPPAHVEPATLEAMAKASASSRRRPVALAAGWFAAIGVGVLLAMLALMPEGPDETERERVVVEEAYRGLLEQSEYLERLLTELPQRQVMRVSTAGTIVGLEERLALIDAELSRQEAAAESAPYRLALMRDRVDTMSALVTVRYAQSPAFSH